MHQKPAKDSWLLWGLPETRPKLLLLSYALCCSWASALLPAQCAAWSWQASDHKHHLQGSLPPRLGFKVLPRFLSPLSKKGELPFPEALGTGVSASLEGTPHLLDSFCKTHWSVGATAAASTQHPELVLTFAPAYSERTVPWKKLTARVWHLHSYSHLSLPASKDAPIYCRSYHQVMQQRTCGCAQRCFRSPEKFVTKRRGSRKPVDLWICDMKDICVHACERERET